MALREWGLGTEDWGLRTGDWGLGTRKSFFLVRTLREENLGSGLNPRTIFPVPSP
ncbi:MAG: hypothetical protein V7L23_16925 [Nostoc sp.]|uniref:hypothetical protein n=1 Tax=Nostoc sp. TaxID=1180 RepID=UPI002FEF2586